MEIEKEENESEVCEEIIEPPQMPKKEETEILVKKNTNKSVPQFLMNPREYHITKNDLVCLVTLAKLNDEVINSYLVYLHNKFKGRIGMTNSFFMQKLLRDGSPSAFQWEGIKGSPITLYQKFIIPVTTGSHWFLICISMEKKKIFFLDSCSRPVPKQKYVRAINEFLKFQNSPKFKAQNTTVPKQKNSYDCGAFMLYYAENIYNGVKQIGSFNQKEVPMYRQKIYDILIQFVH